MLLANLMNAALRSRRLTFIDWRGRAFEAGPKGAPHVGVVRFKSPRAEHRILTNPLEGVGDAYMAGEIEIDEGELVDVLAAILTDTARERAPAFVRIGQKLNELTRALQQRNSRDGARRHVSHHYDLDEDFYRLWLDEEMHYSCAFHASPEMSLEEAQREKARRIAAKLALKPGDRVLDIGCGWGAMALYLARRHNVRVTGISLSKEQLRVARARAEAAGLADRVKFEYADYREHQGRYQRIVSVGMLEHVGAPHLPGFFRTVRERLTEGGVALIHTIGRVGPPAATNPWIRKHIFPGGFLPALSELASAVERSELITADIEILRLHYAHTLHAWRQRFLARRDAVARRYDEEFVRMWDFYLACSEASFRAGLHVNYQIQLCRSLDALPLSRDYLYPSSDEPAAARHRPTPVAGHG